MKCSIRSRLRLGLCIPPLMLGLSACSTSGSGGGGGIIGGGGMGGGSSGDGAPSVFTRYAPLHPRDGVDTTFRVKASDPDGISKVELFVYESALSLQNGVQVATQRPGGTWGLVQTWEFDGSATTIDQAFTHPGFPAASSVRFLFRVTDSLSNNRSESWSFAAGSWPFGDEPIPIWTNGAPASRIDVCFVADQTDYANGAAMLPVLESLIFDGYHTNNAIRGDLCQYWQFYYSPERGFISDYDSGSYVMTIPSAVEFSPIIDHAAVIHTTEKRDWAQSGNFGTEPGNIGTTVHESGHAAFNLADEYNGGGHFGSSHPHHNNYSSQAAAANYNTTNGFPASDVELIQSGWYRPEPANLGCIMLNDGDGAMPDFGRTCLMRALWFYSQL